MPTELKCIRCGQTIYTVDNPRWLANPTTGAKESLLDQYVEYKNYEGVMVAEHMRRCV